MAKTAKIKFNGREIGRWDPETGPIGLAGEFIKSIEQSRKPPRKRRLRAYSSAAELWPKSPGPGWKRTRTMPGGSELAFRQGQQGGVYDAYRTLRRRHPQAAKDLLEAYEMQPDGTLGWTRASNIKFVPEEEK